VIGNDIVDLALAQKESNWKRKGFLNKIFTEKEQLLIFNDLNPELMVWNLWSRKEAAYKIYNRNTGIRGYFPLQIECFDLELIDGIQFGKVAIKEAIYYTKTTINSEYINSIAVVAIEDFDKVTLLENSKYIRKNNGIPYYFENIHSELKPVSISHHGKFKQIVVL
jgi:phosphopantetheinyl transferase (holo-ACP synthase)